MSNLLNKAKDALSSNKTHDTTTSSSTHNTTGASVNTADPRFESTTGTHSTYQGNQGVGTTSTSTNAGPHNSNLLNKADPRVDSDLDRRANPLSSGPTHGVGPTGHGTTTTAGGTAGYDSSRSTNAGPHNSNLLNKLDPRIDSDQDHRHDTTSRVGGYGTQDNTYGGTSGYAGHAGAGGLPGTTGHTGSANAGPHNSNLLNKADPRVDSDRDHRNDPTSRVGGYGTQDTSGGAGGLPGTTSHSGTGFVHKQTGQEGAGVTGMPTGTTATAGLESQRVHDSSLLNRLDPKTKTDSQGRPL